jgi:four helix bundle protein
MRRAAVSIARNIAEGSARGSKRAFRQFIKLARGSNCQLQTQLIIARKLQLGDPAKCDALNALTAEIGKMLSSLAEYLTREIRSRELTT